MLGQAFDAVLEVNQNVPVPEPSAREWITYRLRLGLSGLLGCLVGLLLLSPILVLLELLGLLLLPRLLLSPILVLLGLLRLLLTALLPVARWLLLLVPLLLLS